MNVSIQSLKEVSDSATTEELVAAVETLAEEVESLREENERLRDELEEAKDHAARERAELSSRVSEVEDSVEESPDDGETTDFDDAKGGGSTEEITTHDPQTPLGDCVTLPEPIAETELTANVKRARDVAADVVDYGRSVPAGYAVTSSELRTVLTALKDGDGRAYTETVGRVIEYLDDLGGDGVEVKTTMGGERTVVFSDEFVRRTVAWRNQSGNAVVTEQEATG